MKKNGFVFIETIVTVVVLSASLLIIYNSYSTSLHNEKERLYYDDVAYIYRANDIRTFLQECSNLYKVKRLSFDDRHIITIGSGFDIMFTAEQKEAGYANTLDYIYENYKINQILIVKKEYMEECYEKTDICQNSEVGLSTSALKYIRSINETDSNFYLVVEFAEKVDDLGKLTKCVIDVDTKCNSYYVSLSI